MKRFLAVLAGSVILMGATATAASAKTIHLFSKNVSNEFLDPNGNPFMDPNAEPPVGSYFIGIDNDYRGNHTKHSKKPVATDHIDCTLLVPAAFTVRCDAQIAFRRGMIIADRQTVSFASDSQVFNITAGTGKYRKAKGGTVTSISLGEDSDNSDLVIRY
jgi:hypothetical protein